MRHSLWLTAILALSMTGCVLRGKQQAKLPAVPPPPSQPAQGGGPAARPEPLSIPQTQAQLPPAQPVDPQALATPQPPSQPVEAPAPSRPKPRPTVPAPARSEPPVPAAQTATQPTVPQPAPEGELREQVQEIIPPEELKQLQDRLATRKQEVRRVLDSAPARKPNAQQSPVISRIQQFLQQSEDAEKRGDLRQADVLGEKAQILAREFQGGAR
jgi:hypothetical protein